MNIDTITRNDSVLNTADTKKGYCVKIGRDIIHVVSVFNGTRTASEAIHEAAVKKILFDRTAG